MKQRILALLGGLYVMLLTLTVANVFWAVTAAQGILWFGCTPSQAFYNPIPIIVGIIAGMFCASHLLEK